MYTSFEYPRFLNTAMDECFRLKTSNYGFSRNWNETIQSIKPNFHRQRTDFMTQSPAKTRTNVISMDGIEAKISSLKNYVKLGSQGDNSERSNIDYKNSGNSSSEKDGIWSSFSNKAQEPDPWLPSLVSWAMEICFRIWNFWEYFNGILVIDGCSLS